MSWRILAVAILFVPLASCSTYSSLFSDVAPKEAQAVDSGDSPANQECVRVANERADDAVLALYVSDGSAEQQEIYQSTYRDCLGWHNR